MALIWERLILGIAGLAGIAWAVAAVREPASAKEKWDWVKEQGLLLAVRWQSGILLPPLRLPHHGYEGRHRASVA